MIAKLKVGQKVSVNNHRYAVIAILDKPTEDMLDMGKTDKIDARYVLRPDDDLLPPIARFRLIVYKQNVNEFDCIRQEGSNIREIVINYVILP